MSLLLIDNASPRSSDGMMPGIMVEEERGHLALSWPLLGPLVIYSRNKLNNKVKQSSNYCREKYLHTVVLVIA